MKANFGPLLSIKYYYCSASARIYGLRVTPPSALLNACASSSCMRHWFNLLLQRLDIYLLGVSCKLVSRHIPGTRNQEN